jgi:shikimate kinase/3-dehydroquinate synthase
MSKSTISNLQSSIFLYGPSGSGKSTVGQLLAESLNADYVDLDIEIETQSGRSITEIFDQEGESGFRQRESDALNKVLTTQNKIIALGGGALTIPQNRELAESKGDVVLLNASSETLLSRLQDDKIERPLLKPSRFNSSSQRKQTIEDKGITKGKLLTLLESRAEHYASFPLQIETDRKTPSEISWEIQILLGQYHLKGMASAKYPSYDVRVQTNGLDELGTIFQARDLKGPVVVVTDENVGKHYLSRLTNSLAKAGFETSGITIPAGEEYKTINSVSQLWDAFGSAKVERGSTIAALGGGVVGDLAGFAAASWLRGTSWVVVPTSLLAMVDSSMGGKTGFDLPYGKNLVGAFHPPRFVLADPSVLGTLPKVERINGLAEVIKHGVIADPGLFDRCKNLKDLENLSDLVSRAMAVKVKFIEADPYEKGIRAALNLGHTIGHGVELASGFRLSHGESVAIGMVAEAQMAEQIGLAEPGLANEISAVLKVVGLPTKIPSNLDHKQIIEAMTRDKKKAGGVVKFALPITIGDVQIGVEIDGWRKMIED